jgi:hypothetical protein
VTGLSVAVISDDFGDVGRLVDPHFVGSVFPVSQHKGRSAWQEVLVLPKSDLLLKLIPVGQKMNRVQKLLWEMHDFLVTRIPDRENQGFDAHALQLRDLAHAEGLREGGKALKDIG